ncbi:epimerase [Echinicola sp. CAU 1574]|uniref:Epimerase n=1 Tax=Echinicola arenosa TaxID=2774144 RepID=A0ABR9AKN4_9BACT|nr:NAD(P)-binding domain-containing protein [Echinicola arenosa]MBD8488465.1 epimerase [Echinicola arenosa]
MKISIIGLGWLGLPLAKFLIEKGHQVIGSTTSVEKQKLLEKEGVNAVCLKLEPHPVGSGFQKLFDADLVIINIPPKRRTLPDTFHPEQIKFLKALIQQSNVKCVIYTSATSVYPDVNREVDEREKLIGKETVNMTLLEAESILIKDKSYSLTIIRLGGLLGLDRIPGKYFSGKNNVTGHPPVNYIHQEDAVRLIEFVVANNLWDEIFNGVSPLHPKKKDVYEMNAKELGFDPPASYDQSERADWKQISSQKIQDQGFVFKYEDPLSFSYTP